MNKIKFLSLSLVALLMACFTACESKYDVDHTAHIVGTWTYIGPNYAEALVIKEDGSVLSTGVEDGEYWENVPGTIKIKDNVATMTFEDGDNAIGHIDVVPGIAFSIYEEDGEEWTFNYCKEDLSDEIVGMWVCTHVSTNNEDFNIYQDAEMAINTYKADGKSIFTGFVVEANDYMANVESTYKVIGDLMLESNPLGEGVFQYNAFRLTYSPNSNQLGDILTKTSVMAFGDEVIEFNASMLRVKESLNFTGQTYNYSAAHVSNAKGKDEDFTIMGETFNMTNIAASNFDVIFGSDLYSVVVSATSIKHKFRPNGEDIEINVPITVDGNKVTLDMGAELPGLRKVDMYMFQSANDSQLHIYMHTSAVVNYLANLQIPTLIEEGKLDPAAPAAVDAVFTAMAARIESINVSMVFKARK